MARLIEIAQDDYDELIRDHKLLMALEVAGVEECPCYAKAMELLSE